VKKKNIQKAYERIRGHLVETPVLGSPIIDEKLGQGRRVFLKCENFQVTRSYKPRGALNALMQKKSGPKAARSSGNFAQALSWAGARLGIPVTIVMPRGTAHIKIDGTKKWGAEIILSEASYEAQHAALADFCQSHADATTLSPYDDLDIIAGQGTVAMEALKQIPGEVNHFLAPIGGGGLMGGCSSYIKEMTDNIEVIGVEPEGASDYFQSRIQGKRVTLSDAQTIAEGLRTPCVGEHNWPILNECVDKVLTVTDEEIITAMKYLFDALGIAVEPSGATALAALLKWKPKGDTLIVISGGNIDAKQFFKLYNQAVPPH